MPDPVANRLFDAIAARYGYDAARDGTKPAFAKAWVILQLKRVVSDYEGAVAQTTAATTAQTDIVLT